MSIVSAGSLCVKGEQSLKMCICKTKGRKHQSLCMAHLSDYFVKTNEFVQINFVELRK